MPGIASISLRPRDEYIKFLVDIAEYGFLTLLTVIVKGLDVNDDVIDIAFPEITADGVELPIITDADDRLISDGKVRVRGS